jgi:hypothetical protein
MDTFFFSSSSSWPVATSSHKTRSDKSFIFLFQQLLILLPSFRNFSKQLHRPDEKLALLLLFDCIAFNRELVPSSSYCASCSPATDSRLDLASFQIKIDVSTVGLVGHSGAAD